MRAAAHARNRATPVYAAVPTPGEPQIGVGRLSDVPLGGRGLTHSHDFPLLTYIESARGGMARTGTHAWTVEAGDVYVIPPGTLVDGAGVAEAGPIRGWQVYFTPQALGPDVPGSNLAWRAHPLLFPFVRGAAHGVLRLHVPPPDRAAWSQRFSTMHRELQDRRDGYREAVLAHLILLLVDVARLAVDVVGQLRASNEPLLADVFDIIERRYADALSLRDVARQVNLSPGHLTTVVRQRTGRTVQEWITERRMVQARRLLVETDLSVGEIGRRVGYPSPGYFARIFRQVHGVSPREWRRAERGIVTRPDLGR